jgi:hypothetical protein
VLAAEVDAGVDGLTEPGYGRVEERPAGLGSSRSGPGVLESGSDAATPENEKLGESELAEWEGRWSKLAPP